jgi:SAM-dependent methyltransferase
LRAGPPGAPTATFVPTRALSPASPAFTFTGERFTPEVRGPIWYEHWHRYAVMAAIVGGRRVLDAACGEGYGSFLLAGTAAHVTGVDLSAAAIAHARERYPRDNLAFVTASVAQLPLAPASVDVIASFETIEHLRAQREMLAEFRRVLSPGGVLVISSPNRPVYNEAGEVENEFHLKELDRAELKALLAPGFPQQAWYAQRLVAQSALWAQDDGAAGTQYVTLVGDRAGVANEPAPPMYFVVACAAEGVPLPRLPALSLFDDGALALWRDYARALGRERRLAWDEIDARAIAEDRLAQLVGAVNDLASERERADAMAARVAALDVALGEARLAFEREGAAHRATREQLTYRESARGWVRLPFATLKRRLARGQR